MYQENQYDYDSFVKITDHCDICGSNSFYQTGMMESDLCLCGDCSSKMILMDDGIIKNSIMKFVIGNVF